MNTIVVIGHLGQDPEMKYFDSGKSKVEISIGSTRGNDRTKTDWIKAQFWDKQAENIAASLKKGALVSVSGELCIEKFETKENAIGTKVYVNGKSIQFLSGKQD